MSGWVDQGWTSTKQRIKCLVQGHNSVPPVKQPLNLKSNTLQLSHCTPFVLFYFHLLCHTSSRADKINVSLRPKIGYHNQLSLNEAPQGGSVLPWSLKIMHWSPQLPERKYLCSLKIFSFAPQILKINLASPQIPKNISQFSLKLIESITNNRYFCGCIF